ncbi:cilia- and flagella-associated protein 97 [Parasteatoda tepidariorum]|uniref:cilia- and flagella-associated protein 97 n=1 Tax=Parasteatoda tepidariorum TaxID=114398 RepID=UPI00077F9AED|nr:cilia- and flagella-associated protein 97 [Parasteatoda tepidariorum]
MSLRVGLGASQADLDVQGEIDFDFFDESNSSSIPAKQSNVLTEVNHMTLGADCSELACEISSLNQDAIISNGSPSASSYDFNQPVITISCDNTTGAIQKTIKTVIPTPFNYKDNKCGRKSPSMPNRKVAVSPRFKSKVFQDDDGSDDSSISSMSESESDMSSVSADSFELNEGESDSMTDVSPLPSPFHCSTPNSSKFNKEQTLSPPLNISSEIKKDHVKFTDDVESMSDTKLCPKCDTIDIQELVRAMKRLKMKQNINSSYVRKCKSPILTHNARCRKNLSFTNEEVRRIDNDNQILLKKIIAQQNRVTSLGNSSPRVSSSATVNRHKQQRQIELDNLALLKRLESAKPSRDLNRLHLLQDYDRRSSGVLSRASSRSSYPCSSTQSYSRTSMHSSGRSSAVSVKPTNSSVLRSQSLTAMNKS